MKNRLHTLSRLTLSLVIVLTMLGVAASPTSMADETGDFRSVEVSTPPQDIPASPADWAPRITITLNPVSGYSGQSVTVSGQSQGPYNVRIAWKIDGATRTFAVVKVDAAQAYSATLTVPGDAAPGPAEICVLQTLTFGHFRFVCAEFTIERPPDGSVWGQLPLAANAALHTSDAQAFDATFTLRNDSGAQIASVPIQQDGSFATGPVTSGMGYQGVVVGTLPVLVRNVPLDVTPLQATYLAPSVFSRTSGGGGQSGEKTCTGSVTTTLARVSYIDMTPSGTFVSLGLPPAGSPVVVTFTASFQRVTGANITGVEFSIVKPDKTEIQLVYDTNGADGWQAAYNVSQLPEGDSYIVAKPIMASGCGEWNSRPISVIANPIADQFIRDGRIAWNSSQQTYDFSGTLPDISGALPIVYPNPPPNLPLLGAIENKLDAGIHFEGSLGLDRKVTLKIRSYALARLLGLDIYNGSCDLPSRDKTPPWEKDWQKNLWIGYSASPLYQFNKEVPVYSAPVATFWGIVTVNASVSVGIGGDLYLSGRIYPLAPRLESTLTPSVSTYLKVSIWVDILLGVASAGADATAKVTVRMPLNLDTAASSPVWLGDPSLQIQVYLDAWARVNLLFWKKKWNLASYELLNYSTGGANVSAQEAVQAEPPPRVMASPSVASGPGGRMLSAYIEDTTPGVLTPTMQVMARFWITQTSAWGPPTPLTDGSHAVNDPAVTFVGPDGHALVAWSENTMTQAEDEAAGDNMSAILARQEIYTAYWNGTAWGTPQRLTNDTFSDGRAAIAGDALGATLAWVRDTDGNISTRADWRIAVTHWNMAMLQWGPIELLDGVTAATGTTRQSVGQASSVHSDDLSGSLAASAATISSAHTAELHVCAACTYTNVQAAVDAANPGDIIKVAAGTYTGVQTRGYNTQMVYVDKTVSIQGGYTTTNWTVAQPVSNPTTLDAQGQGRVLYIAYTNITPTIEGLRLTGGHGVDGGGVYVNGVQATLRGNWIYSNTASYQGGGLYLNDDSSKLIGNFIMSNTATSSSAYGYGGGLFLHSSNADLVNNVVNANQADSAGGGLYLRSGSSVRLLHNTVSNNSAGDGSGIYVMSGGSTAAFTNTIVGGDTWGIIVRSGSTVTLNNELLLFPSGYGVGGDGNKVYRSVHYGAPAFAADGYHLTNGSTAAIDQGISTDVSTDIDGGARPQGAAPDIGADEYVPPPCSVQIERTPSFIYTSVQAAVDAASTGDTVKVAGYCAGVQVRSGVTQTVYLSKTLTLRGGYTTANWTTSDPAANPTTLDAQGRGRVIYIASGITSTIEGLRVTGGNATGLRVAPWGWDVGGGLYAMTATVILSNNQFFSNTAFLGGGLALPSSRGAVVGNRIISNSATWAGGVFLHDSRVVLNGNTVSYNSAINGGGGVVVDTGDVTLSGNMITFNTADQGGGLLLETSSATLTNNVLADNHADITGGGLFVWGASPRLLHNTIARNTGGAGVHVAWDEWTGLFSTVAMTNTVLVSHTVGISVTTGNAATVRGVLWSGNTANTASTGAIAVTNAYTGSPAFAADGYHLTINSAAIDRGLNAGVTTDIDGDVRPQRSGFDLGADEWVGWMNAQVSAARSNGQTALAWTVDADSQLTSNGDRRIAVARCSSVTCTIELPNGLPWGADSPSIIFRTPSALQIAFLVRGKDGDRVTDTGIGNQGVLWTAQYTASGWTAAPVRDEQGAAVHAEQPRLNASATGESLILFRRFGDMGTNGSLGQLALSQSSSGGAARPPLYLTDELAQHWQPALAINQATQQAMILNVKRPVMAQSAATASRPLLASASTGARPTVESVTLATSSDPVESLAVGPGADPALDPQLALSQQHALPGTSVIVTTTVRNVGRGEASGLSVRLYAGTPATGTLLATTGLPVSLGFNDRYTVTFAVTTTAGTQPLAAKITTTGSDLNSANNIANADLGELPPPTFVSVTPSTRYSNTLEITWIAPGVSGVAGYSILRGETSGGPYELVGEATGTTFYDVMLERGRRYFYVVQAFDASGTWSSSSAEVSEVLPFFRIYLPLVMRSG